ncbi:helicase associated domain-containing protein [Streptomyces gobitricini]|uniref:Helicase-associated domain-containing protein n=1 Tax=Streptomyces gobitricini TaxID=68211 RepID=A0ABN3MN19_9ACTN
MTRENTHRPLEDRTTRGTRRILNENGRTPRQHAHSPTRPRSHGLNQTGIPPAHNNACTSTTPPRNDNWQRHYRVLADLVDADGHLPYIAPGVLFDGDDIGTWRWRQQEPGTWKQLLPEQRERLTALGIKAPAPAPSPTETAPAAADATKSPSKAGSKAEAAFQRGLAALTQWVEKEGKRPVPRSAVIEVTVDGETEPVPVRLGVWISNTRARRDRLNTAQLAALAALGMEWAGAVPAVEADPAAQPFHGSA